MKYPSTFKVHIKYDATFMMMYSNTKMYDIYYFILKLIIYKYPKNLKDLKK